VDYRRNITRTVAARLFRPEPEPTIAAHRRLDSHAARNRCHTRHFAAPWSGVNLSFFAVLRIVRAVTRSTREEMPTSEEVYTLGMTTTSKPNR